MKAIYKYELPKIAGENFRIQMPLGAETIAFSSQKNQPVIWAKVDPHCKMMITIEGRLVATGEVFENGELEEFKYFGTTQLDGGLVFHLFLNPFLVPV